MKLSDHTVKCPQGNLSLFFTQLQMMAMSVNHYHDSCSCSHFCSSSLPIMTFIARVLWPVFVVLSLLLLSS